MLDNSKNIVRYFQFLLALFAMLILAAGVVGYSFAVTHFKNQLVLKCQALAATVAVVIAEDSDGYAAFLKNMDMGTDYYRRTKALMMKIKSVNEQHVAYIYTTLRVDGDTTMCVIGGEDPSSPAYTAPGMEEAIAKAERIAYDEQRAVLSEDFEITPQGWHLSAYQPILHKDTGEFLGVVGADIISKQYSNLRMFVLGTAVSLVAGLVFFTLVTHWFSGKVSFIINRQRYATHQVKRKLAMENAALERVNRMKADLMTIISHEARTPLAVLASYAGIVSLSLKHKGTEMETAADLDKIVSEAQRVANLIDTMKKLTLSGVESATRTRLDFGELIRQVMRLYRPILERNGVALHMHIAGEYPVYGNPEELTQVVFNIVQNAKDHTERGSVSVSAARENGSVIVTVSDSGTGIAQELLPHIFEHGMTGANGGTGIGLAVCKEIMDAHGGAITFATVNGAVVTLTLPEYTGGREDES